MGLRASARKRNTEKGVKHYFKQFGTQNIDVARLALLSYKDEQEFYTYDE
jgi:hypothetical protein